MPGGSNYTLVDGSAVYIKFPQAFSFGPPFGASVPPSRAAKLRFGLLRSRCRKNFGWLFSFRVAFLLNQNVRGA